MKNRGPRNFQGRSSRLCLSRPQKVRFQINIELLNNSDYFHHKIVSLNTTTFNSISTCWYNGMFESTMIQFGTNQMIEALVEASNQLSTFIHWYYWSLYIGNVLLIILLLLKYRFILVIVIQELLSEPAYQ